METGVFINSKYKGSSRIIEEQQIVIGVFFTQQKKNQY